MTRGWAMAVTAGSVAVLIGGCAPAGGAPGAPLPDGSAPRLPPVPAREDPLAIDVVYPGEGQTMGAVDSTFVFGNVGTGSATLTIDGAPVDVAPNGAFLAFLPIPSDGVYDVVATTGTDTESLLRRVTPATRATPAAAPSAPPREQPYEVMLPDSTTVPGGWVGVVRTARPDGTAIGTAVAGSGTPYHWFFPQETRLLVTASRAGQLRVRLTGDLSVWVDSTDVSPVQPSGLVSPGSSSGDGFLRPLPATAQGYVGNVVATPAPGHVDIRLATSDRLPFRIDGRENGLTVVVYGAETRTNNLLYGADDPLIRRMEWEQPRDDEYRLRVDLGSPLWGYSSFYDEAGHLVVRVRRPPAIDSSQPLRGLYIGIDAGHPPGGAIGPTRLTEAEATLAVSRRLTRILEERGARVLQTRPDTSAVGLGQRPLRATEEGVHLLVSVHFDAFGDGVNPFENHGTHVFYNQAQSLDLARAVQRELLAELGLRDLGVSRRDLALVRPTWMPSILSESAFMMIPRNEAALRDPEVIDRIADAHLRGIEAFLRARAAAN